MADIRRTWAANNVKIFHKIINNASAGRTTIRERYDGKLYDNALVGVCWNRRILSGCGALDRTMTWRHRTMPVY